MGLGKGRLVLLKGSVTIASLWASVACWDWRSRTKIPDLIHRLRGFFVASVYLWMFPFTSGAYRTTPTCGAVRLTGGHALECCSARVGKSPTPSPLRRPLARYRIRRPDRPEHQNQVRHVAEAWACDSFESR